MYPWTRLDNPHAFVREGRYVRTATVTYDGTTIWVVSGIKDLVIFKSTDSEFWGYIEDRYTTLQPTRDRIMADHAREHPGYGWETNKGYPTPEHYRALGELGPTPLHRRSFAPVRLCIEARAGGPIPTQQLIDL